MMKTLDLREPAVMRGTYRGTIAHLVGETALLRPIHGGDQVPDDFVWADETTFKDWVAAQFDNYGAFIEDGDQRYDLSHGWFGFPATDFDIEVIR